MSLYPPSRKPTILLIPGGWHTPVHYIPLTNLLTTHGYPTIPVSLPTIDASPPNKDVKDDIAVVKSHLEKLVSEEEKEVLIVVHSYSGIPGSAAAREYLKKEGRRGGVLAILFISAIVVPAEKSLVDMVVSPWVKIEAPIMTPINPIHVFYNDLPTSEAEYYSSHLRSMCIGATMVPPPADCLGGVVPCTYLICENDNALEVEVQEKMVEALGEGCVVERWDCGHSPFLSMTERMAELVESMVKEGGGVKD